jgi:hypothetical protein
LSLRRLIIATIHNNALSFPVYFACHTFTVLLSLAEAINCPSGDHANDQIMPLC